jgi:hypothetical protein
MRLGIHFQSVFVCATAVSSVAIPRVASTAEKYSVAELKESAPDSLSKEVRDVLGKAGYRVTNSAGKVVCDLWLRNPLPIIDKFVAQNDVEYPIEPGTLVGAIRFPQASSDYRKQTIKAGAYTLRYGQQPQDGNHIGTAQYRDFLMAIPAADDKSPEGLTQEKATEMSKKASGTTHPSIFSILPPQKGRAMTPTMTHQDELNLELLVAKTPAKGGSAKELQIEFVAVGHAPE